MIFLLDAVTGTGRQVPKVRREGDPTCEESRHQDDDDSQHRFYFVRAGMPCNQAFTLQIRVFGIGAFFQR
jgi:hypothetical protein